MPNSGEKTAPAALLKRFRQAFRGEGEAVGAERLIPLEGARLIGEALRSGARIESVLFSRSGEARLGAKLRPQFSKHTEIAVADDGGFRAAMDVEHPQGVAALARLRPATLDELFAAPRAGAEPRALLLVAAALQDPGNLGTLIRAADAFGATGVAALAESVSPFNPKAIRASAGSLFHLPVAAAVAPAALAAACRRHEVQLAACVARGKTPLPAAELRAPVCLVIGQEAAGVPRELQRAAAITVAIPMAAEVESLNAGVAGAIMLYEAMRQRSG